VDWQGFKRLSLSYRKSYGGATMQLSWNRDEDGVITVYATMNDGKIADVADFWLTPLVERFGMDRESAKCMQQNFAECLVTLHNKHFTKQNVKKDWKCPLNMVDCKSNCGSYGCGN